MKPIGKWSMMRLHPLYSVLAVFNVMLPAVAREVARVREFLEATLEQVRDA